MKPITRFLPEHHLKKVSCIIDCTVISEAIIFKEGSKYFLLQNIRYGTTPSFASKWRDHKYSGSWICQKPGKPLEAFNITDIVLLESHQNYVPFL